MKPLKLTDKIYYIAESFQYYIPEIIVSFIMLPKDRGFHEIHHNVESLYQEINEIV